MTNEAPRPLVTAALVGAAACMLLCGYEFVRSPSTSLFLNPTRGYGPDRIPLITAVMPLGVIALLYVYGRLLTWLGPRRTLWWTSVGSGVGILLCYLSVTSGFKPARAVLYVVREAYVVILIEQYWSFLDSRLGAAHAKRLNGPICGIASLGAILGGHLVSRCAVPLGTAFMLLCGATATILAAFFSDWAYTRGGEPRGEPDRRPAGNLGLKLFGAHKLLPRLLLLILATQVISAALDFSVQSRAAAALPGEDQRTAWLGGLYGWINVAAAGGQFIVTPLALRFIPLPLIHFGIPLANFAACLGLVLWPTLDSAAAAFLVFKACDYSLFRAAKEILYIPFPFDVRYRAKELIDVFGYRCGKGGYFAVIAALKSAGVRVGAASYALTALFSTGVWALLLPEILRGYRSQEHAQSPGQIESPVEPSQQKTAITDH